MVRTTIYLPEDLKRELESRARVERRSEADIIREALFVALRGGARTARQMSFGRYGSGRSDTSERVDEVLGSSGFGSS